MQTHTFRQNVWQSVPSELHFTTPESQTKRRGPRESGEPPEIPTCMLVSNTTHILEAARHRGSLERRVLRQLTARRLIMGLAHSYRGGRNHATGPHASAGGGLQQTRPGWPKQALPSSRARTCLLKGEEKAEGKKGKEKRNSMDASELEGIQHSLQDVQVRSTTTRQLHLPPPPLCAAVSLRVGKER